MADEVCALLVSESAKPDSDRVTPDFEYVHLELGRRVVKFRGLCCFSVRTGHTAAAHRSFVRVPLSCLRSHPATWYVTRVSSYRPERA